MISAFWCCFTVNRGINDMLRSRPPQFYTQCLTPKSTATLLHLSFQMDTHQTLVTKSNTSRGCKSPLPLKRKLLLLIYINTVKPSECDLFESFGWCAGMCFNPRAGCPGPKIPSGNSVGFMEKHIRESLVIAWMCSLVFSQVICSDVKVLLLLVSLLLGGLSRSCVKILALLLQPMKTH